MERDSFVVWMDRPGAGGGRECAGRVEHVATSQRVRFESAAELIAILTSQRSDRGEESDSTRAGESEAE